MKYLNRFLALSLFVALFLSCNGDEEDNFDPAVQSLEDDEALVTFMKSHYYNEAEDSVDTLTSNDRVSLFLDPRLKSEAITENEVDYTLYYLLLEEGTNESPSMVDRVFTDYTGYFTSNLNAFDSNEDIWFNLTAVIRGWSYGFPKFKSGMNNSVPGEPLSFDGTGKGYLIIPSGLAYGHNPGGLLSGFADQNLIFKIELKFVEYLDQDGDGILSKDEDSNGNGNLEDDDTDGDGIPNYLDSDDNS